MKKIALLALLFPLLLCACSDDEYVYPNVRTDLVDLQTDETGTLCCLTTDEGTKWHIRSRTGLDGLTADTLYRAVAMYAPLEGTTTTQEQEATLYNAQLILAPVPLTADKFKAVKTDPVSIQSIWRGGNYLNLILQVKVKDRKHAYHFIEDKLESKDGQQTLYLTFYHDRNNDTEGFDRKVYLSVPLWAYADTLRPGDRIIFNINTYKEGMTTRTFTY